MQSGTNKNAGTFIATQSLSTVIIKNCHARCVDDESLVILQYYEFNLKKYSIYEYTVVTKLDTSLF